MDVLIQGKNLSKAFGAKALLNSAEFSILDGQHIAFIGINGSGKTSFLKVLAQELELDEGEITRNRNLKLGYLKQESSFPECRTLDYIMLGKKDLPEWEAYKLGNYFGLSQEQIDGPLSAISGGYKMRAKLAALLASEPNLLLLDEPTNYLDLDTILLLENFLQEFKGAFILVSHDREFLLRTCNHTLELDQGELTLYPGTVNDYFEMKKLWREQEIASARNIELKRKALQEFVDRFKAKASKASQAQSKLKQLNRLETVNIKKETQSLSHLRIPEPLPSGKHSFSLKNAFIGYGEKTILKNVSLDVMKGEHIAIVGNNGVGKTTLLKLIAGELNLQKGELKFGHEVRPAYYAQHVSQALKPENTILQELALAADPYFPDKDLRSLAGSLLFSGDEAEKKIQVLSGGEKSRVALGKVLLSRSALILLDEPTNHLDIQSSETLALELKRFPGTLLVVSHNRSFVAEFASKIWEIKDGTVHVFPGTYEEYVWKLQQMHSEEIESSLKKEIKTTKAESNYEQRKKVFAEIRRLEKLVLEEEKKQRDLEEQKKILSMKLVEGYDRQIFLDLQSVERKIERSENAWMEHTQKLEELKSQS